MSNLAIRQQKSGQLRSIVSDFIMYLALLLIGILAIPTLLFVSVIGGLWALADSALRAIDA